MSKIVTRDSVIAFLESESPERVKQYIGRALVVLFNNQTAVEKDSDNTLVDNGVGFTGADAYSGSLSAKYFLKHRTLADWQVEKWVKPNVNGVPRIAKYWEQLNAAAEKRAEKAKHYAPGAWIPPDYLKKNSREYWEEMYKHGSGEQYRLAAEMLGRRQPNMGNRVGMRAALRTAANPGSL